MDLLETPDGRGFRGHEVGGDLANHEAGTGRPPVVPKIPFGFLVEALASIAPFGLRLN
jgi:hypothetical protein